MLRFALEYLRDWKARTSREPLAMRSARQVGKSYLARMRTDRAFDNLLEVNLEASVLARYILWYVAPSPGEEALVEERYMHPEMKTDLLIAKARDGDRQAFEKLMASYSPRLEAFLRRKLGVQLSGRVEISDLLQETLLQAWKSLKTFRGTEESTFWAWLSISAEHVLQMEARRLGARKRAPRGEVSLQARVRTESGGVGEFVELLRKTMTSPSEAVRRDERFDRLERALEHLSPDHRKVIFLARVQELDTEEVARKMGRSPEAVSMLLYRALLKLRAAFGSTESSGLPDRKLEEKSHGD